MIASLSKYLTMQMPELYGKLSNQEFFLFTACDTLYFEEFAGPLINSVKKNTDLHIHLHIFNPSDEQIKYCESEPRVSITYEYVPLSLFENAAMRWSKAPTDIREKLKYDKIITAARKGKDLNLTVRLQKTYYACARFIRLFEILGPNQTVFAIDVDAVVRKPLPKFINDTDLYIHRIHGSKARFLAGGLYILNSRGVKFLQQYSLLLKNHIEGDYLYWGLDQDLLEETVKKFNYKELPMSLIDWEMHPESYIWTAKGIRKELEIFISEQKKYIS
jgi:hypothetical protein